MQTQKLIDEMRRSLRLAWPLIVAGLAQMGVEAVDTLMMGRLGPSALAAGALGSAIFGALFVICVGALTSVGVLVARAYGAEDFARIRVIVRQGLWAALFLALPITSVIWFAPHFLLKIGEDPAIIAGTSAFLHGLAASILPLLGFFVLREFVCALSKPRIVMIIAATAIPFNALASYILMYGKLGLPALGIAGIGIASSIVEWLAFITITLYVLNKSLFHKYKIFAAFDKPNLSLLLEIFRMGAPVAILYGFEVGLFSITTLMMGFFGTIPLAGHQIALQCVTVAFMIPMGISQATAVRVGLAMGAKRRNRAKRAAYIGILLGLGVAGIAAICFWLLPKPIIMLFLNIHLPENQAVVKMATLFLGIAAIFELMDALQVVMTGVLRALKDTFMPMLMGLLSYWCVGLGTGYILAFKLNMGGMGLWWGLAIGITVSALLLMWRFSYSIKIRQ